MFVCLDILIIFASLVATLDVCVLDINQQIGDQEKSSFSPFFFFFFADFLLLSNT